MLAPMPFQSRHSNFAQLCGTSIIHPGRSNPLPTLPELVERKSKDGGWDG